MKYWYVYKIVFEDNKFYIGYRGTKKLPEEDFLISYFSSSKEVIKKIKDNDKYCGTIIQIFDSKEPAYNFEQDLIFIEISNNDILNKFCYKNRKGYGILTESAKQKIAKSSKERWSDPLYKEKLIQSHKARWTDELKNKQSKRLTGIKRPEHSKMMSGRKNPKLSESTKGVPKPSGFGTKISKALSGVPKSDSAKLNMSLAAQNRTPEYRQKISESSKNTPKKECLHCCKIIDVRNYGKYHGAKCKMLQSLDLSK